MKMNAWIGAIIGALLGAVLWSAIAYGTNNENGYIAWIVGGMVGMGARIGGGEGFFCGMVCAGLTLVAICEGKILTIEYSAPKEIEAYLREEIYTEAQFEEIKKNAQNFLTVKSRSEYPKFMIQNEYTEANDPSLVTDEELEWFTNYIVPWFADIREGNLTFEEWREDKIEGDVELIMTSMNKFQMVYDSLNHFDIIFALLGIFSAYKIGSGLIEESA